MRFITQAGDWLTGQFAHVAVWAGSDNFRWKMKTLGWVGWSVRSLEEEPPAEEGYEKEE